MNQENRKIGKGRETRRSGFISCFPAGHVAKLYVAFLIVFCGCCVPAFADNVVVTNSNGMALPVKAKQYEGAPSNFAVATANATVFTLAAGEIGFIQNLDDAALAVKKGASASSSSFNLVLSAGAAADDGKGGYVTINDWVGAVSVAAMAGSPRFIAWKQAP
jgi:hypothetical protein